MKSLKIFFIVALLSFFASGNNFAQTTNDNKYFSKTTLIRVEFNFGICDIEPLTGIINCYNTYWSNGKTQIKAEGTLIGESGKEYYLFYTANWNETSSKIQTNPVIAHIFCEGQLVALKHDVTHLTIDADGIWHLDFYSGWTKCF